MREADRPRALRPTLTDAELLTEADRWVPTGRIRALVEDATTYGGRRAFKIIEVREGTARRWLRLTAWTELQREAAMLRGLALPDSGSDQ